MVEERFDEQWSRLFGVDQQREQRLLLLTEVGHGHGREEAAEGRDGGGGLVVGGGSSAQTPCFNERVMVVVRERDQCWVTFHVLNVPAEIRRAAGGAPRTCP